MAKPLKGDVVVVPFPFSDLSQSKRRPALVIADLPGDDLILCQITSQATKDQYAILIEDGDFQSGGLRQQSHVRPNRIFTADSHLVLYRIGSLKKPVLDRIIDRVVEILRG